MTNPFLPPDTVHTQLVEFANRSRAVQGVVFTPVAGQPISDTAAIFVHGVEHFWFLGPTMFLAPAIANQGMTTLGYNGIHSGLTFRHSTFEEAVDEVDDAIRFCSSPISLVIIIRSRCSLSPTRRSRMTGSSASMRPFSTSSSSRAIPATAAVWS